MARNQNYDVNYKLRGLLLNGQGGDIVGDLTELEQRILLLEQNKQDNLIAGQGIIFSGNTISAQNIIDDTRNSSTTVWSSNKVKSIVESFEGGVNVVIVDSRPSKSEAIEKTMYYVGNNAPYHIWFFLDNNYVDFGTTEISLESYYTKLEIDNLLGLKVDKEEGKVLIPLEDLEQITTNKNDISALDSSKVDKEEGKTLISSEDLSQISLNKVNIANLDDQKVDKVSGKSLVLNTSISQITTNKNDIADIKNGINTIQDDISGLTSTKQDKITDSALSSVSDSTTVSSVSAADKTNKTFSLSKLWEYIRGKISSSSGRGINVTNNVIGHSNAEITAKTNTNVCGLKYDKYGHVTDKGTEHSISDTYKSTADNQLFTRKGAYGLYNDVDRLGGVFYRNGTQSVSTANWTNILLTSTESGDTSIAELSSNGVKIKVTGVYRFTIVLRIPDTTSTLQWGVGITGSDDDLRGGSWNYTHTRHKVTTVIVKPISANSVIYPRINIISGASSINYCQMTVEKLK